MRRPQSPARPPVSSAAPPRSMRCGGFVRSRGTTTTQSEKVAEARPTQEPCGNDDEQLSVQMLSMVSTRLLYKYRLAQYVADKFLS
mmetsp:Transcript_20326/g.47784  ORF Transcript_20326/g.47784 Transcript_20326/m.47784 type:complete len:86 (+) Transcript_20326:2913-3170(+)